MDDLGLANQDPLRAVDWRRQLAVDLLVEQRYPGERKYGSVIHQLAKYQQLRQVRTAAELAGGEFADLHLAYQVFESQPTRLRATLEAFILADVERTEIAKTTGITANAVAWYEAAFFDVRMRLSATDFILNRVIENARRRHPNDWPLHGWLLVGYLCGPNILREVMGAMTFEDLPGLVDSLAERATLILRTELLRTAERMPADSRMAADLLHAEIKRPQPEPDKTSLSQLEQIAEAVCKNLRFTVGEIPADSPLKEFEGCAAELRTHQLLQLGAGIPLENAEAIKAMRLPPPRSERSETDGMSQEFPAK